MINKEIYKSELIRMLDSHRTKHKGEQTCVGVKCEECPLYGVGCGNDLYVYETIEAVEKWSKEHPPKKFKISKIEYEFLRMFIYPSYENARFKEFNLIRTLRRRGYFNGSTEDMKIKDYLDDCEVVDNDD